MMLIIFLLIIALILVVILGKDSYSPTDPRFQKDFKTNCWDCQRSGYCGWAFDDKPGKCAMFEKKIRK